LELEEVAVVGVGVGGEGGGVEGAEVGVGAGEEEVEASDVADAGVVMEYEGGFLLGG